MRKLAILFTIPLIVAFSGILWLNYTSQADTEPQTSVQQPKLSKYEVGPPDPQELLELVNKERAKVGVKPLKLHKKLNESAQYKADDMLNRGYYAHEDPKSSEVNGLDYLNSVYDECSYVAENINAANLDTMSTVQEWVNSKPHHKVMIDKAYTLTGFGVAQKSDGGHYTVQHFCEVN